MIRIMHAFEIQEFDIKRYMITCAEPTEGEDGDSDDIGEEVDSLDANAQPVLDEEQDGHRDGHRTLDYHIDGEVRLGRALVEEYHSWEEGNRHIDIIFSSHRCTS